MPQLHRAHEKEHLEVCELLHIKRYQGSKEQLSKEQLFKQQPVAKDISVSHFSQMHIIKSVVCCSTGSPNHWAVSWQLPHPVLAAAACYTCSCGMLYLQLLHSILAFATSCTCSCCILYLQLLHPILAFATSYTCSCKYSFKYRMQQLQV
jgi:hypothetical protein